MVALDAARTIARPRASIRNTPTQPRDFGPFGDRDSAAMKSSRQLAHLQAAATSAWLQRNCAVARERGRADAAPSSCPEKKRRCSAASLAARGLVEPAPVDRRPANRCPAPARPGCSSNRQRLGLGQRQRDLAGLGAGQLALRARARRSRAGTASKATPAASSIARREALLRSERRIISVSIPASTRPDALALALVEQVDHRRGGLLDRAAGDVDHRPAIVGEHPPRKLHFALRPARSST